MRMRMRWLGVAVAVGFVGACVGGSLSISQRFAAVHNVLAPAGFGQVGPISEGRLGQGESAEVALPLASGQCYAISAFGDDGIWDLDAELRDPDGQTVAADPARSPQASLHYCAARGGTHRLRVSAASGAGRFAVAVWSAAGGTSAFAAGTGGGTCAAPANLALGATVRGSTANGSDELSPSCVGGGESQAPEAVYRVVLEQRGMLSLELRSQYDAVLSLLSECTDDQAVSIDCNDDAQEGDTSRSALETTLEPGTYYVVVDGYGTESGNYTLTARFTPLRAMSEVCADLPVLMPGEEVEGTTAGEGDEFRTDGDCAAGSRAPDVAYQLRIDRPSRVRVHLQSEYDGVVAIRSDCARQGSVVACNDDFGEGEESRRESQVVAVLDPGTYTVIVDGYEGEAGRFRLLATVVPVGEASAPNDTCARAAALEPDQDGRADTFAANDDYRGSCIVEPGAPDVAYRVEVARRSLLSARATGEDMSDPVLYLQRNCGEAGSEIACGVREINTVVGPGTYYLIADGARRQSLGRMTVRYELADVAPLEAACSDAPVLTAGQTVRARTSGPDRFQGTCGEGTRNPEAVYSLRVRERSRVQLSVEADFDCVLYVRRDCVDPASTVDCNDDAGDSNHSLLDLTLDPGTYYVFVDGYGDGNESGAFTLRAEVSAR